MDKAWMARQLPEQPPEGLLEWAIKTHGEKELGGEFCVFTSERMELPPPLEELMENNRLAGRKEWVAVCTCTACNEDFITQKEPGEKAIRLICGDDGSHYTVEPGMAVDPYMGIEVQREGDEFYCPLCGSKVELIHKSSIRGGRTKRIMVISLQVVQGYLTLMYWLVQRHLDENGCSTYGVTPEEAYVLTEHGGLIRYTHVHRNGAFFGTSRTYLRGWSLMSNNADVIDSCYQDWRSVNGKKCGADYWPEWPDLEGTTGEKTAVVEYLEAGGYRAVGYLKWWRRRRGIENLCRQGQAKLVVDVMRRAYRYAYSIDIEAAKVMDLSKKKPYEILGIRREDFRWLRSNAIPLDLDRLEQWKRYKALGGKVQFTDFLELAARYGNSGVNAALELLRQYGHDLDKAARYLEKRSLRLNEAGVLLDTRRMLRELYNRELTQEELWPKRLHEAHDRANGMLVARRQKEQQEKTAAGFRGVIDQYGSLQWTDGELCMVLPLSNDDLVREGAVLRHCVGGYGNAHVAGTSVIFFVRHYRRPERPYYTLAMNMTKEPRRSQLHGYGNERHGKNKEYSHKIPYKVKAFCDRWEQEVLLSWYAQQQKNKKEAKTA